MTKYLTHWQLSGAVQNSNGNWLDFTNEHIVTASADHEEAVRTMRYRYTAYSKDIRIERLERVGVVAVRVVDGEIQ